MVKIGEALKFTSKDIEILKNHVDLKDATTITKVEGPITGDVLKPLEEPRRSKKTIPVIPGNVKKAFQLIFDSNMPRYEKAGAKGMIFALETVRDFLDAT